MAIDNPRGNAIIEADEDKPTTTKGRIVETYTVRIGTPARRCSAVVKAPNADAAIAAAVEKLVEDGHDREWLEAKASNRDRRTGTCSVEEWTK